MLLSYTGGTFFGGFCFHFSLFLPVVLRFLLHYFLYFVRRNMLLRNLYGKKGLKEINLSHILNAEFLFEGSKYFLNMVAF